MSDVNSLDAAGIPQNFWAVPESFISDESLRFLHTDISARLRDENPDADTLEIMAIERVASLYFYMRSKELDGGFGTDASYKGMMQLWTGMAADLRKARTETLSTKEAQAEVMTAVVSAINEALIGFEPEIANTVRRRMTEQLGALG